MPRWLEHETDQADQRLIEREKVRKKIEQIINTPENRSRLAAIADSRRAGVWRIKRAKIILRTLEGETVKEMVLKVRVPPESIIKCQNHFAETGFAYFDKPDRKPTPREIKVERMLAFLEYPPEKRSSRWRTLTVHYIGKEYAAADIQQIRELVSVHPDFTVADVARQVCELFTLFQDNGKLKITQTQQALKRMEMDNIITLPSLKRTSRRYRTPATMHDFQEQGRQPVQLQTADIANLQFIPVQSKKDALLWRTLIEKYHYIKTTRLFGSQIRYLVYGDPHLSGTLSFVKQTHPESVAHWGPR